MRPEMGGLLRRYVLYLGRWQLSTPILAPVVALLAPRAILGAVVANLIGGLIFFWVDRFIFTSPAIETVWHYKDNVRCADCGRLVQGRRLVKAFAYDRTNDPEPEFRCLVCSNRKLAELRERGVKV